MPAMIGSHRALQGLKSRVLAWRLHMPSVYAQIGAAHHRVKNANNASVNYIKTAGKSMG